MVDYYKSLSRINHPTPRTLSTSHFILIHSGTTILELHVIKFYTYSNPTLSHLPPFNLISAAQEDLHIQDCPQLWHIADWLLYPWHYRVTTLCCTAVNLRIHLSIASEKCSCQALGMSICMEPINQKLCVCKEDWLPCHIVWSKSTCKVINDPARCLGPSGNDHWTRQAPP